MGRKRKNSELAEPGFQQKKKPGGGGSHQKKWGNALSKTTKPKSDPGG